MAPRPHSQHKQDRTESTTTKKTSITNTTSNFWQIRNTTQLTCWCMSRNHGHGRNPYHHIKIISEAAWRFLWPEEPENCEEDIQSITVKPRIHILETPATSTRQIPTEKLEQNTETTTQVEWVSTQLLTDTSQNHEQFIITHGDIQLYGHFAD